MESETGRYINLTLSRDETVYLSTVLALSVAIASQNLGTSLELTETVREILKREGVELHNNLSLRLERLGRAAYPELTVERHEDIRQKSGIDALIDMAVNAIHQGCEQGRHCACADEVCCWCNQLKGGKNG